MSDTDELTDEQRIFRLREMTAPAFRKLMEPAYEDSYVWPGAFRPSVRDVQACLDAITFWQTVADGVAHDPRCGGGLCLRCRNDALSRRLRDVGMIAAGKVPPESA